MKEENIKWSVIYIELYFPSNITIHQSTYISLYIIEFIGRTISLHASAHGAFFRRYINNLLLLNYAFYMHSLKIIKWSDWVGVCTAAARVMAGNKGGFQINTRSYVDTLWYVVTHGYEGIMPRIEWNDRYSDQNGKLHKDLSTDGGVDVQIQIFLISLLVWDEWSASRPGHFALGERAPGYRLGRRLSGLQSRSGRSEEERILDATGTRTPNPPPSSP
jgi:hypothetical protein